MLYIFKVTENFKRMFNQMMENQKISDGAIFRQIVKTLIPLEQLKKNYKELSAIDEYNRIIEATQGIIILNNKTNTNKYKKLYYIIFNT